MKLTSETKVGLFALAAIVVVGFVTLKVGSRSFIASRGYDIQVVVDHAIGIRTKTPVEIAGIKVGQVKKIELTNTRNAMLTLTIDRDVTLPTDSKAYVRSKGFLGEIVVELVPGGNESEYVASGGRLEYGGHTGDFNLLISQFNSIAEDIKAVTSSLKTMSADESSPVWNIVKNLEAFSATLAKNQANFDKVSGNLAELTDALRGTVAKSRENVEESIRRIGSITRKIDEGQGTVGKLINDDETVTKLNQAIDNLNSTLGGLKSLETEIGYHAEYLTGADDFKHFVNLTLRPKPDKAFIFDFVQDPTQSPNTTIRNTTVTAGGATSSFSSVTDTVDQNSFRFSAQLAKKFYDLTVRGGIVESRGGFGMDYDLGPASVSMTAYDFSTRGDRKPHVKTYSTVNVTKNFYLMGGMDNMLKKDSGVDWFMGAGIRLVDDDVKSLIGIGAASMVKSK